MQHRIELSDQSKYLSNKKGTTELEISESSSFGVAGNTSVSEY
ncbi:hypothetical protein [Flavobacterium sp. ZS1P14]